MGKGNEARLVALFNRDFGTDLTQRLSDRTVPISGDITRDVGTVAAHGHPGEGQLEAWRHLHRFGQHEAEVF
jgi:hypothetical protein